MWTGADAREQGLVDELGGFWAAVAAAKALAEIDPETRVAFRDYPSREGWVDRVATLLETSSGTVAALRGLETLMSAAPVKALLQAVENAPNGRIQMKAIDLPGR